MSILLTVPFFVSNLVFAYPAVDQARPSLYGSAKNVKCPVRVVPHQSIDRLKLGMQEKELGKLGLEIKEVPGSGGWLIVGP